METAFQRLSKLIQKGPERTAADKLRMAIAMVDEGREMMRLNLKRMDPGANEQQIEERLAAWLRERPGAELGDTVGSRNAASIEGKTWWLAWTRSCRPSWGDDSEAWRW